VWVCLVRTRPDPRNPRRIDTRSRKQNIVSDEGIENNWIREGLISTYKSTHHNRHGRP